MIKDDRGDPPVFQTFDTASVNYKPTKIEIGPEVIRNILECIQKSSKPLLPGPIAVLLNLRLNVVIEVIEELTRQLKLKKLSLEELRKYSIPSGADAYWILEKLSRPI